jgi:hypothetical protein
MRRILTAILFSAFAIAGTAHAEATVSSNALVWCGLDYSKVKMIGTLDFRQPSQIFPGALLEWNGLFMKEMLPKLEAMFPLVESDLKAVEALNEKVTASQIEREDGTRAEKVNPTDITETNIADIVASYSLKHDKGIGLVFIMDRLVKAQETGCLYVVFFDISSRKVLHSERVVARAGGFGFRNYWFSPIKTAVEKLPKMYKQIIPAVSEFVTSKPGNNTLQG